MPDILLVIALFKSQSDILSSNMLRTSWILIWQGEIAYSFLSHICKRGLLPGSGTGSSEESEKRLNTLKHFHNVSEGQ